jgi:hypothetical protein
MAGHDIIVVGTSAGGGEAQTQLVRQLPPSLPAAEQRGNADSAERFEDQARVAEQCGVLLEQHLLNGQGTPPIPGQGAAGGEPGAAAGAPA